MTTKRRLSPLTALQILEILNELPPVRGIGRSAVALAEEENRSRLEDVLKTIRLVDHPNAFPEFKREVLYSYYASQVEVGKAVGIVSAVSVIAPIQQLTLDSHRFVGVRSGVANSFQKIKNMITGSKMVKDPAMTIFFKRPNPRYNDTLHTVLHEGTETSIFDRRAEFERTTVDDIRVDSEILTREEAFAEGLIPLLNLFVVLRPDRRLSPDRQRLTAVLKITCNGYRMYTHGISMMDVAKSLEGGSPPDTITCIWRSQRDAILYVLVDESKDFTTKDKKGKTIGSSFSANEAVSVFLDMMIKRSLKEFHIKGIPGIIGIEPKRVDVTSGIDKIEKLPGSRFYIWSSHFRSRWLGVSMADLERLFVEAGYKILNRSFGRKLLLEIEGPDFKIEDLNKYESSKFYVGETVGANLSEMAWREDVDHFRTISNSPHEIAEMYGIDAARLYLILKFREILLSFSSYINVRHISLMFDMLTTMGMINSLSFSGINRRKTGALGLASNARATDVVLDAAKFGAKESVIGVSPSIYLGKVPANVGTGTVNIVEDPFIAEQEIIAEIKERFEEIEDEMKMYAETIFSGSTLENDLDTAAVASRREKQGSSVASGPAVQQPIQIISSQKVPPGSDLPNRDPTEPEILAAPAKTIIAALQQVAETGNLLLPAAPGAPRKTENTISPVHPPKIFTPDVVAVPPLPSVRPGTQPKLAKPLLKPEQIVKIPTYTPPAVSTTTLAPIPLGLQVKPVSKTPVEQYLSSFPTEEELRRGGGARGLVPAMDVDAIRRASQR